MATARLAQPDGAIVVATTIQGTVSVGQFVFNSSGSVIVAAADTNVILGLALASGVSGDTIPILVGGIIEMEASAAIAAGGDVAWQTAHESQPATSAENIIGMAVTDASGDGVKHLVNFRPSSRLA